MAATGSRAIIVDVQNDLLGMSRPHPVLIKESASGLTLESIDLGSVLPKVQWPVQVRSNFLAEKNLTEHFWLYKLTLPESQASSVD